jgi:hypothetical protein
MSKFKLIENYIKIFREEYIKQSFIKDTNSLSGLSGAGTAQVISESCKFIDWKNRKCYLEVGIYQASNFIQIAKNNPKVICYGVDNFSESFNENKNYEFLSTEQVVLKRINDLNLQNCKILKYDYVDFFSRFESELNKSVEIYYYDGPHTLEHQIKGIELAMPLLSDEALIFIDDFASPATQESVLYLKNKYKELKLLKVLNSSINLRNNFNQGQVVFKFERNK